MLPPRIRPRAVLIRAFSLALGLCATGLSACSEADTTFAPTTDPSQVLKSVRLRVRAYNLLTSGSSRTVALQTTALLSDGTPAPVALRYAASDTLVTIDSTGLLRAIHPGVVQVTVAATYNGVTQADTARVSVSDSPAPPVHAVDVHPQPGDSASMGLRYPCYSFVECLSKQIVSSAVDASGTAIPSILVDTRSGNPTVALAQGCADLGCPAEFTTVQGLKPGSVWIYGETYVYGTYYRDSLEITVREPYVYYITAAAVEKVVDGALKEIMEFTPTQVRVPPGSDIVWKSPYPTYQTDADSIGPAVSVIFDDSSAAEESPVPVRGDGCNIFYLDLCNDHGGSGNMVVQANSFRFAGSEVRRFNRTGRFPFHNTQGGAGVVIVE